MYNLCSSKDTDPETFGKLFLTVLRVFVLVQLYNIGLKLDGFINWPWKEVFWPFWVFFTVMVGLSIALFLLALTRFCSWVLGSIDASQFIGIFWIFYLVDGFTDLACAIILTFQDHKAANSSSGRADDSGHPAEPSVGHYTLQLSDSFECVMIAALAYLFLCIVLTFSCRRLIKQFILVISEEELFELEQSTKEQRGDEMCLP